MPIYSINKILWGLCRYADFADTLDMLEIKRSILCRFFEIVSGYKLQDIFFGIVKIDGLCIPIRKLHECVGEVLAYGDVPGW